MCATGAGIAVIAVVCIGFLVFLIILGIARIRSAQRRSVEVNMDDRQEMEWDNSALNITVNPMDREVSIPYSFSPSKFRGNNFKILMPMSANDLQQSMQFSRDSWCGTAGRHTGLNKISKI